MKKFIVLFILAALLFFKEAHSATHNVEMRDMKFVPASLEIKVGDVVVFTNKSNYMHNVVSPANKIRSKFLKKDQKFEFKFEKAGVVDYYCEPHKAHGMKGKIDVK